MKLVIVESPFKGKNKKEEIRNIMYGRKCMHDCLKRGEAPFASHLLYTQEGVLDDQVPEERKLGIEAGLLWGSKAEKTVVFVDYGISDGMLQGIEHAQSNARKVEYRTIL